MDIVMPAVIVLFVVFGLCKRVGVFEAFAAGAVTGLKTAYAIAPTLIGLITAVGMLKASGLLEQLTQAVSPLAKSLGFPAEIVPIALLRPISGGGSTALLVGALRDYGADSDIGRIVSVMAGSTETTFYAIAVYYGSVGIKKIRHTLLAGLAADFAAVVFSVLTVRLFY